MTARTVGKIGFGVGVFFITTAVAVYLAGVFFLAASWLNPLNADFLTYYQYWYYYHADVAYQPRLWGSALGGAGVAYGGLLLLAVAAARQPRPLHGAARFATGSEIARAGLFADKGILLGRWGRRYLCLDGQTSVMLAAPARSGKGVGVVIPNALNWPDSLVVLDIRLEAFDATSGYRAACGQPVVLFNPLAADRRTARWNPLHYITRDAHLRISDIQRIGALLLPDPVGHSDPMWTHEARSLFLGVVLYLAETPELPLTLGETLRQLQTEQATQEYFRRLLAERPDLDPAGRMALASFCAKAPEEASGVRSNLTQALGLWANPLLDAATSCNDFDLRELRRQRMSVYLGIPPSQQAVLQPVIRLFMQQVVDLNTQVRPDADPSLRYQLLLLLDEFTGPGRMDAIAKGIAYLGGYNVRLLLVFQAPSQLRAEYGPDTALTLETNTAARIIYAQKEEKLAREIAEELGAETVEATSINQRRGAPGPDRARDSTTTSAARRLLLLPQEVKTLGQDKAIIVMEHIPPILARKIVYYRDRAFKKRLRPPVDVAAIDVPRHDVRGQRAAAAPPHGNRFALPADRPLQPDELAAVATQWWSLQFPAPTPPAARPADADRRSSTA